MVFGLVIVVSWLFQALGAVNWMLSRTLLLSVLIQSVRCNFATRWTIFNNFTAFWACIAWKFIGLTIFRQLILDTKNSDLERIWHFFDNFENVVELEDCLEREERVNAISIEFGSEWVESEEVDQINEEHTDQLKEH